VSDSGITRTETDYNELLRAFQEAARPAAEAHERLKAIQKEASIALEALLRPIKEAMSGLAELVGSISILTAQLNALESAGFLPHQSMPFDLVKEHSGDAEKLSNALENYYRLHWNDVRLRLLTDLESYPIDDKAKETFREAICAHELGFYRFVCRGLFPEIERVARVELGASTRSLQEDAGELGLSETGPQGLMSLSLFRRLTEHLYLNIGDDEVIRSRMEKDPVPNRHATIHGLVNYSSFKNSLNTIFMTNYVFQVIRALKARSREKTPVIASSADQQVEQRIPH
jgi:hypothetical protein